MGKRVTLCISAALLALPAVWAVRRWSTVPVSVSAVVRRRIDLPKIAERPNPAVFAAEPAAAFSPLDQPKLPGHRSTGEIGPPSDELLAIVTLRYGGAMRALELSSSLVDQLTRLLAERVLVARDVLNVSRAAGVTVDSDELGLRRLLATAQGPTDAAIRQLVGDTGFDALVCRDENLRVLSVVTELQQQLERSTAPLRDDRADALGRILAATAPPGADGAPELGAITTAAVSRSWEVLGQPQVAALERMQRQQETARRLPGRR